MSRRYAGALMKSLMLALALVISSGCSDNGGGAAPDAAGGGGGGGGGDGGGGGGGGVDASLPTSGFPLTGLSQGITYTANSTIGSQTFDVVVDTGSTSLAVAGQSCSNCNTSNLYSLGGTDQDTTSSSTYGYGTAWTADKYSDQVASTGDSTQTTMRFGPGPWRTWTSCRLSRRTSRMSIPANSGPIRSGPCWQMPRQPFCPNSLPPELDRL